MSIQENKAAAEAQFNKGLNYSRLANAATDEMTAIKQVSIALNHYTLGLVNEIQALSSQIDELKNRLDQSERSRAAGLSTILR